MVRPDNYRIEHVHFLIRTWINYLKFLKQEISLFRERLQEVAFKNTSPDIKQNIEQYENRFYIFSNHIDVFEHEINLIKDAIQKDARNGKMETNPEVTSKVNTAEGMMMQNKKDQKELRTDFYKFLQKVM